MIHGANWQAETLGENLKAAGVSRRSFMKFCGGMAAIFAAGTPDIPEAAAQSLTPTAEEIAGKLAAVKKPKVAWLQLQECTGCMESVLRSGGITAEELVLDLLSVDYNELIMAASGEAAEKALHDINQEEHILVVNGSIPVGEDGVFCTIGGKSAETVLLEAAEKASAILAVGACAVYGSVQAARPNPTMAKGVDEIIKDKPVINVSGCPPIGEVITATLTYVLTYGRTPEVDAEGRPKFAYDQRIHDSCPRRAHFDAGQFVRTFDDEGARNGWCLYEVGCKGPSTFSPCPIVQWNMKTGWPIGAGHPCIGCTEKDFFDKFTPFYKTLPNIPGIGIESTATKAGLGLIGVVAAGTAIHGGLTVMKSISMKRKNGEEKLLAAFGDQSDNAAGKTSAMSSSTGGAGTATATRASTLNDEAKDK